MHLKGLKATPEIVTASILQNELAKLKTIPIK